MQGLSYLLYTAAGIFMLLPFLWVITTSLKQTGHEFLLPPEWIPHPAVWGNYAEVFKQVPFLMYTENTLIIAVTATATGILTASLAGYGFARLRFPGREVLFSLCLSTLMVPYAVTMIPEFVVFKTLGWVNTFLPLIIPAGLGGGAFAIFLFRQYFLTLPMELDEAARVDGAGSFRIWWEVLLPLAKPIIATVAILSFFGHWNDFLRPLIYLSAPNLKTLTLGLLVFQGEYSTEWNLLMAASALMILPIMVIFLAGQRYIVRGIVMTGLAGR
jgi:multiple sugar transport system permease protein